MNLNDIMESQHVIRVHTGGSVTDATGVYAPEICVEIDDDGQITADAEAWMIKYAESQGWDLMTGYSSQFRYAGPVMHPSEFVGGSMEDDILGEPGLYVVCEVTGLYPEENYDDDPIGWVVARRLDDNECE